MAGVTHVVSIWDGYLMDDEEPRTRVPTIFPKANIRFAFFNDVASSAGDYVPTQETVRGQTA